MDRQVSIHTLILLICLSGLLLEKPTDVYVLRARAALTDFTKRHRAWRDLERLIELDPANRALYQAEIQRWRDQEMNRLGVHAVEFTGNP